MTDLAGRIRYAAAAAILSGVVCSGCGVLPQGTLPSLPFTAEESGAETAGAAGAARRGGRPVSSTRIRAGDAPATWDSTVNAEAAGDSAGDAAQETRREKQLPERKRQGRTPAAKLPYWSPRLLMKRRHSPTALRRTVTTF